MLTITFFLNLLCSSCARQAHSVQVQCEARDKPSALTQAHPPPLQLTEVEWQPAGMIVIGKDDLFFELSATAWGYELR